MKERVKEHIIELYKKYEPCPEGGGRDSWDIAADVIKELLPPEEYSQYDPGFLFNVKEIWNIIQEYINSTWVEDERTN